MSALDNGSHRWFDMETSSQAAAVAAAREALSDEGFGPDDFTVGAGAVVRLNGCLTVRVRASRVTDVTRAIAARNVLYDQLRAEMADIFDPEDES